MPRIPDSPESRILRWFRTAPLPVAVLVLGVVKDMVHERQVPRPAHRRAVNEPRFVTPPAPPAPAVAPPVAKAKAPTPKKRRVRKSRAKVKPAARPVQDMATVESFE
jgi:hypothetical protein